MSFYILAQVCYFIVHDTDIILQSYTYFDYSYDETKGSKHQQSVRAVQRI